jgi:hypothetical protein
MKEVPILGGEARAANDEEFTSALDEPTDRGVTIRSVVFGFFLAVAISLLGNMVR